MLSHKESWLILFRPWKNLYHVAWLLLQPRRLFLRVQGLENIPRDRGGQGLIVIANHISWKDPWNIGRYFPFRWGVHWLAKLQFFSRKRAIEEFPDWPKWKASLIPFVVQNSLTIPVDKNNPSARENIAAYKLSLKVLEGGGEIGIFPRGTFKETKYVNTLFIVLAIKTKSPILPVFLCGDEVVFGPMFSLVPHLCGVKDRSDYEKIAREIIEKIEARHQVSQGE